jgi:hypothetical protein
MEIKRRAARGIAVLAVALGAGYFVQNMGQEEAPRKAASAELVQKPTKIEPVAAGPEAPLAAAASLTPLTPPEPKVAPTAPVQPLAETPPAPAAEAAPVKLACDISLELIEEQNAIIGITLLAPCQPNQRVVLKHAGLVVTAKTTATGAVFTALPALETDAMVEAIFADGAKASGQIAMPELAALRRFGVQWQADDAFQIQAFEGVSVYGGPGHVSAATPQRPAAGMTATAGFLTLVGDSSTENPLLAEVYTFPIDPEMKSEIVVEAAVTEKTCGRELLGETLTSTGGSAYVTDLTLAMPDCDAIGDYLVLKNLVPDLNMASAN